MLNLNTPTLKKTMTHTGHYGILRRSVIRGDLVKITYQRSGIGLVEGLIVRA